LVLVTMKNAARCETWRDTQNLRDVEFLNAACARGAIRRHVCLCVLITFPGNWRAHGPFAQASGHGGAVSGRVLPACRRVCAASPQRQSLSVCCEYVIEPCGWAFTSRRPFPLQLHASRFASVHGCKHICRQRAIWFVRPSDHACMMMTVRGRARRPLSATKR
jgi:hypothetical protein